MHITTELPPTLVADHAFGRSRPIASISRSNPLDSAAVLALATDALDELKGVDVLAIDIAAKTSIADAMLICTGTSQRHVRSLAESVRLAAKGAGHPPLGVEGDDKSDWVLVDLGDVIVHVMTEEKREFYALEKLWEVGPDHAGDERAPAALHSV